MSRTLRAVAAIICVAVITVSLIIISQHTGRSLRADITERNLYTLSQGSRDILAKLNQPVTLKLYFSRTAARKAPDQIRYYKNYFRFVKSLLEEYVRASGGMVKLQIIDPLAFSEAEENALRYGLKRFPITEEESFFFGLVLQTGFGTVKQIPFFTPERDSFVEYDISQLIDSSMTRDKKVLGILSSLPVMGEDASGYMAQLKKMQGQQVDPPWKIIQYLQQKYKVVKVDKEAESIDEPDILLVIHPEGLPEKSLFAIDQFVLKGGRTVVLTDPHAFAAQSAENTMDFNGSNLNKLLNNWGADIPDQTFAGDRNLAIDVRIRESERMQSLIGYLNLNNDKCFNRDINVTANLNEVRMLFAGGINEYSAEPEPNEPIEYEFTPLIQTTPAGNTWSPAHPQDLLRVNSKAMLESFTPGIKPVVMGAVLTGRFKTAFPDGVDITEQPAETAEEDKEDVDKKMRHLDGIKYSEDDCAVVVFSDVDFISDMVAFQDAFFGLSVAVANNSDLLLNTVDYLSGSSELIGIRSRGNYQRPFTVVEEIRQQAEKKIALEVAKYENEIARIDKELSSLTAAGREEGDQELIESSKLEKIQELELQRLEVRKKLRRVNMAKIQRLEELKMKLQNINCLAAPAVFLVIGIALAVRRRLLSKKYKAE